MSTARAPHFPAFLDLAGRRAVVIGRGAAAERKVKALERCGARVRRLGAGLSAKSLRGAALVICATSDEALNARVQALCRRLRVWVNVADRPALCDFIMPSVLRRGPICVAVSTGGASPALARDLRLRLERHVTKRDAALARRLARLRPRLLRLALRERRLAVARILAEQS